MKVKDEELAFEWDESNRKKIFDKHGLTSAEMEEIFIDPNLLILSDVKHSQSEQRYIAIGKKFGKRALHIIFTMRAQSIRAISARRMHRKESARYEKIKKDSTF